jgi:hypothetical protein
MLQREELPRQLRPFVEVLARRFEPGRDYTETEVNLLLMGGHTFSDWALLRRMLYDWRFLDRESDCSRYWLNAQAAERISEALESPS